jgi:ketosteroid isomerase-like protein
MDARDEIARRRADFVTAFNREDLASLEQLCTDDIVMLPPNQPPISGIRDALEWWSVGFQAGRTTVTIVPCELYVSEGWAMDWFDWSVKIVPVTGTVPIVDSGSSFWVWRLRDRDGWRILRSMWKSSSDEPSLWAGGIGDFMLDGPRLM